MLLYNYAFNDIQGHMVDTIELFNSEPKRFGIEKLFSIIIAYSLDLCNKIIKKATLDDVMTTNGCFVSTIRQNR